MAELRDLTIEKLHVKRRAALLRTFQPKTVPSAFPAGH
jgi:hypothetical protein